MLRSSLICKLSSLFYEIFEYRDNQNRLISYHFVRSFVDHENKELVSKRCKERNRIVKEKREKQKRTLMFLMPKQ